ncbi:MAG: hypothetical protein ACRECP_06655 [Methylocella sp.]
METPYLHCALYFAINPARRVNSKYPGKVPACGTISLVKRSTQPVIIVFPREPSFARAIGQIQVRRQTAGTCGPDAPLNQQKYSPASEGERLMGEKRMKTAVARVFQ